MGRVGNDIDARDGAIGKNENGSDGVDVLLDLIHNAVLVELVLPNAAGVGPPRCLEDANFGRVLLILATFTIPTLTTMMFLLVVRRAGPSSSDAHWYNHFARWYGQDVEVVVVHVITSKDIGDEVQD